MNNNNFNLRTYNEKLLNNPLNKEALNKVKKTFYDQLDSLNNGFNNCIFKNKQTVNSALIYTFNYLFKDLRTNKDLINLFNLNNNKKIKEIGINYKPYLLCLNMHNGSCNLCNKCYSSKQELARTNNKYYSLLKSLSNFIVFYYCIFTNKKHLLYRALLKTLNYNTYYFKTMHLNRYNIKSDIDNQLILNLFNDIHLFLKRLFNNKEFVSYTYTKNKDLNYKNIDSTFIINKSYGLRDINYIKSHYNKINEYNSYITIDLKNMNNEDKKELKELYRNGLINICSVSQGITEQCIYCLNPCHELKEININIGILH